MFKDFNTWNKQKIDLENKHFKSSFKEGDIWWCSIGINIKQESCGKGKYYRRPVLVLRKFSKELCFVIPMTSQTKYGSWHYFLKINDEVNYLQLHQARTVSSYRLTKRVTSLPEKQLNSILHRYINLLNNKK